MLKLIIEDDEGRKTVVPFVRDEITIGRQEGNTIRLTERNVSRRHARLIRQNGTVLVEDLGSYNGIRINGERIRGQVPLRDGDLIQIGDYDLAIQREAVQAPPPVPTAVDLDPESSPSKPSGASVLGTGAPPEAPPALSSAPTEVGPSRPAAAPPDPALAKRQSTSVIRVDQVERNRPRQILELAPEEAPRLVLLNTESAGREYACIRTELKIGRTDENDIGIDHRSLSRTHAKVVREDSGEWRVIDLQSANGLMVNGESYAEATLRSGDVVELGYVKFKFLAPGEAFQFIPGDDEVILKSRGPGRALIAGLLVVLGAGAGGYWYLQQTPQPTGEPDTATMPGPPEPVAAVQPPEPPDEAPAEPTPPREVEAAAEKSVEARLAEAKELIGKLAWAEAADVLAGCKVASGALHPEAKALLAGLKSEADLKAKLERAQRALEQGDLGPAKAVLPEGRRSKLLAKPFDELRDQLKAAEAERLSAKRSRSGPSGAQGDSEPDEASAERPSAAGTTPVKLYQDGWALLKNRQFREARTTLERCIKADAAYAPCHKLLGAAYAQLGHQDPELSERGAHHYRRFLQLAPNDPDASKVRMILENYELAKETLKK